MTASDTPTRSNGHPTQAVAEALALAFADGVIALNRVIDNLNNHRRTAADADSQEDAELTDSIRANGVIQPVIVWEDADGFFHLIAGHRRCRCARRAGLHTVPARKLSRKPTDNEINILALLENTQRKDIDPLELGLVCVELLATYRTATELAKVLHKKSVSTITRAIALVEKLPADLRGEVKSAHLPPTVARELVSLPDDETKRLIARRYLAGELKTRAEVTAAVRAAKNGNREAATAPASLACEAAGIKLRLELAAGQGLPEAEAALRELVADLKTHRGRPVAAFRKFLAAKALAKKKAAEHQAASDALAGHLTPNNEDTAHG
jgi:ParB/RepB/Spo0J family partition protein